MNETHLSEEHFDGEIHMNGFINHYVVNRTVNAKHGGVMVYIGGDLAPRTKIITSGSIVNIEYLVLYLKYLDHTMV